MCLNPMMPLNTGSTGVPTSHQHTVKECVSYLSGIFSNDTVISDDLLSAIGGDIGGFESGLENISRRIRYMKNVRLPIMHLPPEVLFMIFCMLRTGDSVSRHSASPHNGLTSGHQPRSYTTKWTRILHVCRRWREIAFACPPLWNNLDIRDHGVTLRWGKTQKYLSSLIDSSIKQSGIMPLVVHLNPPPYVSPDVLARVPHLSRTQELYITARMRTLEAALAKIKMPRLPTLSLDPSLSLTNPDIDLSFMDPSSIHYLSLASHNILSKHEFSHLKQLRLHRFTFNSPDCVYSFLDTLAANRSLQDILFNDTMFDLSLGNTISRDRAASDRVQLPKLRRIAFHRMSGDDHTAFDPTFLEHISLPPRLALTVTSSNLHCLHKLLGSPTLHCSSIVDATTVVIAFGSIQQYSIAMINAVSAWQLEICRMPYHGSVPGIACVLYKARQLWTSFLGANIQSSNNDVGHTDVLWTWLGSHDFEEVVLSRWEMCLDGARWALQELSRTFPNLHRLQIHGVNGDLWTPLLNMVQQRKLLGYPVDNLAILCLKQATQRERATFEEWMRRAPDELQAVKQIEFCEVDEYPRPRLPSICASRNDGSWPEWYDWSGIGDIDQVTTGSDAGH